MSKTEKLHILIAETSPVLAAGLAQCLRRMPGMQTEIREVKSPADLTDCMKAQTPNLVVVNPTFGGMFNPAGFREEFNIYDFKIVAIEVGKLNRQAAALYDDVISVIDDMETITSKIKKLCTPDSDTPEEKDTLSQREKEIISLVVKGMTNQEIADKLFLSIHTVITHRRNIARKLEIHSATGLTIYAIVNKIVDITDIKL
ncbi:MAG: response regulator transcription factor [Bacteroides sp.]|nr:response regulator transcription factor [Bacteroides sp.]MBD5357262.1 response regulator transcription factor [Bacteroides sp.]